MFAAQDVHVIRQLVTRHIENPQRAGAATHRESAVIHSYLQEVVGRLIEILDTERCAIDSACVRTPPVGPAPNSGMKGVDCRWIEGVSVSEDEGLRTLLVSRGRSDQNVMRIEKCG